MANFDAIVVGSGISGGWAAKELTERGLKVLMIERGREVEHRAGYTTEGTPPWEMPYRGFSDPKVLKTSKRIQQRSNANEWEEHFFVDDEVDVYDTPAESNFIWLRGYQTGGRSLTWGRHSYRMAEHNFAANAKDGHGIDWPIRYKDLEPWYDHVETFIGVNGTVENIPGFPDGKFQPSMGMNAGEQRFADILKTRFETRRMIPGRTTNLTRAIGDRQPCQHRNQCRRGCSFGAYFSTQASTLPAAVATGRLTQLHDSIVESIDYDPKTKRATGVRIINAKTGARSTETAKIIFLCAGSINSVAVLLRSVSDATPGGLGNSGGVLGRYLMDHARGGGAVSTVPGIEDKMYLGRRPNGVIIPRFVNIETQETDFLRGYSYQGAGNRATWIRGAGMAGVGDGFKAALRKPGPWQLRITPSIENLPNRNNTITVDFKTKDKYGVPITRIDLRFGENEKKALDHAHAETLAMLSLLGGRILNTSKTLSDPGSTIHEMGGACMGKDPRTSVTNAFNQVHDAPNVFVTDGAAMSSCGDRNPSLTYMALTARAAAAAASMVREGAL